MHIARIKFSSQYNLAATETYKTKFKKKKKKRSLCYPSNSVKLDLERLIVILRNYF